MCALHRWDSHASDGFFFFQGTIREFCEKFGHSWPMIKVGWVHYGMAGASLLQWVVKFCYGGCGLAVAAGATEDAGWRCSGAQESLSGTRFFSGFFFFFLLSHLLEYSSC